MSFIDIATGLATKSLTLFAGTGLSKYLTNGHAPSWVELLYELTKKLEKQDVLLNDMFEIDNNGTINVKMELTVCAQILELEYQNENKDIRNEIVKVLSESINDSTVDMAKVLKLREFLHAHPYIDIFTTNYDNLLSDYVLVDNRKIIVEGGSVARAVSGNNIYHIHGSIHKPNTLVLTMNDYFNFQHKESYLSRKLFTTLQESTVAIIGYSLGDFNLNRILNEVHHSRVGSYKLCDVYYINKNKIDDLYKRYYLHTYGIEVIESCSVDKFLREVTSEYPVAKSNIVDKAPNLKHIIAGVSDYVETAVKTKGLMRRVLLRASLLGIEPEDTAFQSYLVKLLKRKASYCREDNAWPQYAHLADWLIHLASILVIHNTPIKDDFEELVVFSLSKMSKGNYIGYSWEAYEIWAGQWQNLKQENKQLIIDLIKSTSFPYGSGAKSLLKKFDK